MLLCAEEEREFTPIKNKASIKKAKRSLLSIVKERWIFLMLDSLLLTKKQRNIQY